MGYRSHSRKPPENREEDIRCSKCNLVIETEDGRRYRMKWRHYHCLPDTRLAQIKGGQKLADRTREKYSKATEILTEELEQ